MTITTDATLSTSTGHKFSEGSWLDRHYFACQAEYEAMLKSVGLQQGWHVLDAGCGSGSFLPLMSQLVGASGRIQALDLAPENVARVETNQSQNAYACPVEARVGTVTKLPYEDDTFDAVWCAAIAQYLDDDQLGAMLSEFQRVLKPGGLLALKDSVTICREWQPIKLLLVQRLKQALIDDGNRYEAQIFRNASLPTWVKKHGYKVLRANTVMVERWQPIRDVERAFTEQLLVSFAELAKGNKLLSNEDKLAWEQLGNIGSPDHILNHPDFYSSEGHMMIVAINP